MIMVSNPGDGPIATYSTHPLHFGASTNIRLIEVLPASSENDTSPISCKLLVVPLDAQPLYTALSYVWGDASFSKTILLDGDQFVVRNNLWDFLNHWRGTTLGFEEGRRYLWIDAISIDQSSIKERNHQVAIMGRIYSEAKMTISWLGSGPAVLVDALDVLQRQFSDLQPYSEELIDLCYEHFNILQTNVYWTRVWIIQECVLAKRFELWCGNGRMSSAILVNAIRGCSKSHPRNTCLTLYNIIKLRGDFENICRPPTSLSTLCGMFPDMACADVRDRLFALLSLVSPQDLSDFPVRADYSTSASDLFLALFRRGCIKAGVSARLPATATIQPRLIPHNFRHSYNARTGRYIRTGILANLKSCEKTQQLLNNMMMVLMEMFEIDVTDENYLLAVMITKDI